MAGSSNLTQNQLIETIWVLVQNITVPFASSFAEIPLFNNGANQLQFNDNAYNQAQSQNMTLFTDGTYIYIQNITGDPTSGA